MKLDGFFEENKRIAVAFSGGVDSAYLLYAAVRAGADVKAYCVRSAFQPGFEFEDARKLAEQIGTEFEVIEVDVLSDEKVTANPADRCYYCKTRIMTAVKAAASADGYKMVCDGTNASDDATDRPGTKALQELGIRSPLRECGLNKTEIRPGTSLPMPALPHVSGPEKRSQRKSSGQQKRPKPSCRTWASATSGSG